MHNSLSVNINVDANLHRSQSAIKLTFSSTINGHSAAQMTPLSGDLCKSEMDATTPAPATDPVVDSQTTDFPASAGDSMDNLEYLDELSDLLDKLEEDPRCYDSGPETTVSSERSGVVVAPSGRYSSAAPLYPPAYCGTAASTDAQQAPGCVGLMGGTAGAPTLLGDTGPAAETLKQMAAQHQSLHENSVGRHYAYTDGYHPAAAAFRGAAGPARMPRYRAVMTGGAPGYIMPAGASSAMCQMDPRSAAAAASYGPVYPDSATAAQYRAAAPARFGVASSLQRLETQVRSQFAPMPVTASPLTAEQQQHFRVEQSQRVDVRAPGQAVVARQQQSFVMSLDAQQQQQQQSSHRAYPSPANPAVYTHYPGPQVSGCRMPGGQFVSASCPVPGGYGAMSGRMAPQQAVGVPPSYGAVQSQDLENVSRPPSSTRGRASSSLYATPASSTGAQLPTKVEAGVGYGAGDVGADLKGAAADAPPTNGSYAKLTHAPQQRPPNVTVVPGPGQPGAMSFHPHAGGGTGVRWMPPGAVQRHPYAAGYPVDTGLSRPTPDSHASAAGGWSLNMSQTQSVYMSNTDIPYHLSGPPNAAAAVYPSAGTVQDQSRMQRIPNTDIVFQRNAAGQVYKNSYHPAAYNSRDFAYTDTVFVSK